MPDGWASDPSEQTTVIPAEGETSVRFAVTAGREPGPAPILADVTVGDVVLGHHADARVTVR